MGRILLSLLLGVLSVFVFILGAEPFGAPGGTSVTEIFAGSVVLAMYLGVCQFFLRRGTGRSWRADWPIWLAMAVPLLAEALLVLALERPETFLVQGVPMSVAGCVGILAGALLAHRGKGVARTDVTRSHPV